MGVPMGFVYPLIQTMIFLGLIERDHNSEGSGKARLPGGGGGGG